MKKEKPKGKIVSGCIYSPQEFLCQVTGVCYCLFCDEPIVAQMERLLIHHRKPYSSFPLIETQKVLNHKGNFVLVDCCELTKDLEPTSDYRWFYVPKDFEEAA